MSPDLAAAVRCEKGGELVRAESSDRNALCLLSGKTGREGHAGGGVNNAFGTSRVNLQQKLRNNPFGKERSDRTQSFLAYWNLSLATLQSITLITAHNSSNDSKLPSSKIASSGSWFTSNRQRALQPFCSPTHQVLKRTWNIQNRFYARTNNGNWCPSQLRQVG